MEVVDIISHIIEDYIENIFIWHILLGSIAILIGHNRNGNKLAFFMVGFLFGIIGWIIIAQLAERKNKKHYEDMSKKSSSKKKKKQESDKWDDTVS